jgi:hypothetical protein
VIASSSIGRQKLRCFCRSDAGLSVRGKSGLLSSCPATTQADPRLRQPRRCNAFMLGVLMHLHKVHGQAFGFPAIVHQGERDRFY